MYSIAGVKTEEIEEKIDIDDYFGPCCHTCTIF
jgi:hypothetical protein